MTIGLGLPPSAPLALMPVVQMLEDEWTRYSEDARKTFDLPGSNEKESFWDREHQELLQ